MSAQITQNLDCPPTRWANIYLRALRHNVRFLQSKAPTSILMGVVKADAYGHNIRIIAPALIKEGVTHFGVATLEEALELQEICPSTDMILVLGALLMSHYALAIEAGIDVVLHSFKDVSKLAQLAKNKQKIARVHLKIDTGMGRVGFLPEALPEILDACTQYTDTLRVVGVCSHLSCADAEVGTKEAEHTQQQIERFAHCRHLCEQHSLFNEQLPLFHFANSDGILNHPKSHHDMIRPGIALYGYTGVKALRKQLRPVLALQAQITQRRQVPVHTPISYGCSFVTQRPTELAVVGMGYADGVSRCLSNQYEVVINQQKVPAIGRVTMDQTILDLTDLINAGIKPKVGDTVTFFGYSESFEKAVTTTAQNWADLLNTIPYEILTSLGQRIQRLAVT